MAEFHADEFIRLAFPNADFKILSTRLEKELVIKTRIVDSVIKIVAAEAEHLIHFEFQTDYQTDIAKRIFIYAGALTAKYDLPVTSILFQLKPPPKKVEVFNRYDVNVFETITNSFSFQCVKLWQFYDDILSGKQEYMGLVPLLLELTPKPDANLLRQQRELIQQERDINRRTELTGLCLALASKYFTFSFLNEFFKEDFAMLEGLEQVPYIGEKIKNARSEGMQQGKQQGMQQGMQQGIRDDIIETLKIRFKSSDNIESVINEINNVDTLRRAFHLALTADSLEAFQRSLANLLKK